MKKYCAICFDFDYTLGDSTDSIVAGFQYGFAQLGKPIPTGRPCGEPLAICWRTPIPCSPGTRTRHTRRGSGPISWRSPSPPAGRDHPVCRGGGAAPGTPCSRCTLGIVSTKTGETIEYIMERYGLKDALEFVIGSYDVTHHKPHPEGILKAVERMGVAKEDFLYCGDTVLDAQAAQRLGWTSLPFSTAPPRRRPSGIGPVFVWRGPDRAGPGAGRIARKQKTRMRHASGVFLSVLIKSGSMPG